MTYPYSGILDIGSRYNYSSCIRATKTGHVFTRKNGQEVLVKYEDSGFTRSTNMDASWNAYTSNGGYLFYLIRDCGIGRTLRKAS